MTIILPKVGIFYASVPKVACTSVKEFFFKIENGFEFRPFKANGRWSHIHHFYPAIARKNYPEEKISGLRRVTVVRDPVSRFLSAYSNRVIFHKELSKDKAGKSLEELGLQANPDLDTFVDLFDEYRKANVSIHHHTKTLVNFLGDDPSYFHKVYRMNELPDLARDMNEIAETNIEMPHSQKGGPKLSRDALSAAQLAKIEGFYADDYKAFGRYF
ncbi:sulfotransferase family 2 domain-containing protein [Thioclava sp. GXIMD4216]|uniref:sulfotransferase family 2 domain-containing protein n=1 Tax=Thioclava sp. GXIMD4216 TaxID=3131929 RepID=UPI0030D355B8